MTNDELERFVHFTVSDFVDLIGIVGYMAAMREVIAEMGRRDSKPAYGMETDFNTEVE